MSIMTEVFCQLGESRIERLCMVMIGRLGEGDLEVRCCESVQSGMPGGFRAKRFLALRRGLYLEVRWERFGSYIKIYLAIICWHSLHFVPFDI